MEFKVKYTQASSPDAPAILQFQGALVLQHIQALQKSLLKHARNTSQLLIQTSKVEALDVSFLQLLISLQKEYATNSKHLSLQLSLPAELEQLVIVSGFTTLLNPDA